MNEWIQLLSEAKQAGIPLSEVIEFIKNVEVEEE